MGSNELATSALEAIYEAAAAPVHWPQTLHLIAQSFDAEIALLVCEDGGRLTTIPSASKQAIDFVAGLNTHRTLAVPRALAVRRQFAEGFHAINDFHICTIDEIATLPWYTEFLGPRGLGWFMATRIPSQSGRLVTVDLQRAKHKGAFSEAEMAHFVSIGRHIEKSLRLNARMLQAESVMLAMSDVLTRLGCAVFLLDHLARITFANRQAEALLGKAFAAVDGHLIAQIPDQRQAFELAIARALASSLSGRTNKQLLPVILGGSAGVGRLVAHAMPWPLNARQVPFASTAALILVCNGSVRQMADPALVRDLLGLTLGEARVASLIAAGHSPREAAVSLGITFDTARTVLKRIFNKVGVSRQVELASLVGRLILPDLPGQ